MFIVVLFEVNKNWKRAKVYQQENKQIVTFPQAVMLFGKINKQTNK